MKNLQILLNECSGDTIDKSIKTSIALSLCQVSSLSGYILTYNDNSGFVKQIANKLNNSIIDLDTTVFRVQQNPISVLYINSDDCKIIESIIQFYITQLLDDGLIIIEYPVILHEKIANLASALKLEINNISYMDNRASILRFPKETKCNTVKSLSLGVEWSVVAGGWGDIFGGLAYMESRKLPNNVIIVSSESNASIEGFIQSQPFVNNTLFVTFTQIRYFLAHHFNERPFNWITSRNILRALKAMGIRQPIYSSIIDPYYVSSENVKEIGKLIKFPKFIIEPEDEKCAYNLNRIIDKPFLVLCPLSYSTSLNNCWKYSMKMMEFIIKKYSDIPIVLAGTWYSGDFAKYDNVIDFTSKTERFQQILALLQYRCFLISTLNSLPIWNNIHQRPALVFDNCNPTKEWFHYLTSCNGTVEILKDNALFSDVKNIVVSKIDSFLE